MDILVISTENNILHIYNKGYSADYTIYNSKGHNMDGGLLESSHGILKNNKVIQEIVSIIKENFSFNSPYLYLQGNKAEPLLELIEEEDYKHMKSKVSDYLNSIQDKADMINNEMELEK